MRPNVLVVEDTQQYRDNFCKLLSSCFPDIRITDVEDGTTALSITRLVHFDLIIIDYYLRALSGGDIVRHLRRRASATGVALPPIIVMSSHPDVAIFTRTMGATAFLNKPARAEDVIALVGPLLDQSTGTLEAGLAAREFSG